MNIYKGTPCMPWPGELFPGGYGAIYINGKSRRAHRVIYENVVGPIPPGLVIDHLCRNRCCVNPKHMEAVTNRENVIRGIGPSAINARKTHCNRGHEFSPENTSITKNNERRCMACDRTRWRAARLKKKHKAKQARNKVAPVSGAGGGEAQ